MYIIEELSTALVDEFLSFAPSGVNVFDGSLFGTDGSGVKNPSMALVLEDMTDLELELGSTGSYFVATCTMTARSKRQRDALKSIVFQQLKNMSITTTSDILFDIGRGIRIRDVPQFAGDRETYFWIAVASFSLSSAY